MTRSNKKPKCSNQITTEGPSIDVGELTVMGKPQHVLSIPNAVSPQQVPNHLQSGDQASEGPNFQRLGKQFNNKDIVHIPRAQRPKRKCVRKRSHYFDDDDNTAASSRRFSSSSTSAFTKKTMNRKKQQSRTKYKNSSTSTSNNQMNDIVQHKQRKMVKNNTHKTIDYPIQNDTKHSCLLQVSPRHNRLVILSVNNHDSMDKKAFGNTSKNHSSVKKSERICFQVKGSQQGFITFDSLFQAKQARMITIPSKKEMNENQLLNLDLPHPTSEWYVADSGLSDSNKSEYSPRLQSPLVDTKIAMKSLVSDDITSSRRSQHILYGEVPSRRIRPDQIKSSLSEVIDMPQCQEHRKQRSVVPLSNTSERI